MRRLKHRIKLLWLKRKWAIQSIYNTKEFRQANDFLELEKVVITLHHKAKRGGDKNEIAEAKGMMKIIEHIKEIE